MLPETHEEWLADYLRLEFGERERDPDSIKASDLEYIGEFVVDGVRTRYWSFPATDEPMWATIEFTPEGECAGMTDEPPPVSAQAKLSGSDLLPLVPTEIHEPRPGHARKELAQKRRGLPGFMNIFLFGKIALKTAEHVRETRSLADTIAALPMPEFVPECLRNLNQSGGAWTVHARLPDPDSAGIAAQKNLPAELAEFYSVCDGFHADGTFSDALLPIKSLCLGADHNPPLSGMLTSYWRRHGNDSSKPGMIPVLPPNSLMAIITHAADSYLSLDSLDLALLLCPPEERRLVVVLLADAGENLPRGTVLDIEGGSATRYPGFKAWLAGSAAIFGSMAERMKKLMS